jgi:CHAT domain-containing protein
MKSIINRVGLLLSVLHLTGTLSTESLQAQTIIPTSPSPTIKTLAQDRVLLSQTTVPPHLNALDQQNVSEAVPLIEQFWEQEYGDYFKTNFSFESMQVKNIAETLAKIATQTEKKSAVIYLIPRSQRLELVLITAQGQPVYKRVLEAKREVLLKQVQELNNFVVNPVYRNNNRYLSSAQQLYRWMISPIEADLQAQGIDTLLFCVGEGLRTLPFAALHDGQQFLVEKYSFSRIPAFKLTDTVYADLRNSQVLAMGASEFKDQNSLPAVPLELAAIRKNQWQGKSFLNQDFTLTNLQSQRTSQPFRIIHLATHAEFQPGVSSNSYIQFWDTKLTLDRMKHLGWNDPIVELLVLSACRTALGDKDAELGFAGLAVQARVKSVVASLWNVSDQGTFALMAEFYRNLKTAPIKAEALRQAQISMLKGQARLQDGHLQSARGNITLPSLLAQLENEDLSHPYYWAAFTVVGNPW